ncbi:MAG: adenylate/guanylate cyclase domain-containing protein, partial [Pseudomonadota bacterium]
MRRYLLPILIGALALAFAVVLRVVDPWPIETARLAVFDSYQRLKPRDDPPLPVRIVDIGDASLERYGQWPWPRTVLSNLVEKLIDNGAAAIAFAMIFPEPDRTSPARAIEIWPETPELDALVDSIAQLPDHDDVFAETLSNGIVVLGFSASASEGRTDPDFSGGMAYAGSDPRPFLPHLRGGLTSLPVIDEAAWGRGSLVLSRDIDGTVRRAPLLLVLNEEILPSLSVEALRAAQQASTIVARSADASGSQSFGDAAGVTSLRVGDFVVPTTANGEMWLYFEPTEDDEAIEAWQVLDAPAPDPEISNLIAGHIVVIGTSAAGLLDIHATPLDPATPGVAIHAQAIEQMISGTFLERPDWAAGAEVVLLVVIGLLLILIIPLVGVVAGAVLGALLAFGSIYGSWLAFDSAGLLLDPVYPSIAVLLIYVMVSFLSYMRTEKERGQVRSAFSRYLSPQLVKRVAENPKQLRLGGESRELTLLFSDIRGFTSISETMSPEELTSFINSFLTPMTEIILEHDGTIDKYMGDAIMAFWNAPLDDAQHAENACRAALAMRDRLALL